MYYDVGLSKREKLPTIKICECCISCFMFEKYTYCFLLR